MRTGVARDKMQRRGTICATANANVAGGSRDASLESGQQVLGAGCNNRFSGAIVTGAEVWAWDPGRGRKKQGPMGQEGRSDRESPKQNDKGRTGRHNTFEGGSGSAVRSTNGDKTYLTINNNN